MEAAGISYHGRLVMSDESGDGWFTQSRYGSLEDAHRGTALVRMLLHAEMERRVERAHASSTHITGRSERSPLASLSIGGSRVTRPSRAASRRPGW